MRLKPGNVPGVQLLLSNGLAPSAGEYPFYSLYTGHVLLTSLYIQYSRGDRAICPTFFPSVHSLSTEWPTRVTQLSFFHFIVKEIY